MAAPAPKPPGPSMGRAVRRLLAATGTVALIVALVSGLGFVRYEIDSKAGTDPCFYGGPDCGPSSSPDAAVGPCANDVCNYLILGSDSRTGLSGGQIGHFGTNGQAGAGRSADVIMLVHTDPKLQKAIVLSFPRDLWVAIPGNGDGKIGTSFGDGGGLTNGGGPRMVARVIHELSGLKVNHYLYVDLAGFENVVQTLGGVDMCIPAENADPATGRITDPNTLLDIAPGCQRLDPLQALAYVRARHLRCDGAAPDYYRIGRQQQFLRAVLNRLLQPGELIHAQSLVGPILSSLHRDDGLKIADLAYLVGQLRGIGTGAVEFRSVPASDLELPGISALKMDPSADAIFRAVREGRALGDLGLTPVQTPPSPANVTVPVVDHASAGKADDVEGVLTQSGFDVTPGIVTYASAGATVTGNVIAYATGHDLEAKVVQQYLPGLELREVTGLSSDVAVFVTRSYTPAQVGGGTPPTDCLGPTG